MRGEFNVKISERKKGGNTFKIKNLKTLKTAVFVATDKATENGKYFRYLFHDAIERTKK